MTDILISQILALLVKWEYLGIFLSSMGLFPTEVVIAILATTQEINIWMISFVSALGALFGSSLAYLLGYILTEEHLYNWLDGNGKFLRINRSKFQKNRKRVLKRSFIYIFLTRLVPWLRVVSSMAAGFLKVNIYSHSVATFLGSFLYTLIVAYAGSRVEGDIESLKRYIGTIDKWIILLTLGYILGTVIFRSKKKASKKIFKVLDK